MVGDSGVGKSCLLEKFIDLSSNNAFISTIGVDVRTHVIKLDGQSVKLQVISRVFFHQKTLVKTQYFLCNLESPQKLEDYTYAFIEITW